MIDPRANLLKYDPVIQQKVLSSIHIGADNPKPDVIDQAVDLFESLSRDSLIDRIKSGELDNSTPISLPPGVRDRLTALFERNKRSLEEDTLVWFTYRVDESKASWVSWPIVGYASGFLIEPYDQSSVVKALRRIGSRSNIVGIKVTGRLPRHHYFGRDIQSVLEAI